MTVTYDIGGNLLAALLALFALLMLVLGALSKIVDVWAAQVKVTRSQLSVNVNVTAMDEVQGVLDRIARSSN